MKINEIMLDVQDDVYTNENLSLPFITSIDGNEKIGFFIFTSEDTDDNILEITAISRIIAVDYETSDKIEVSEVDYSELPLHIEFEEFYSIDEIDSLYESYYEELDTYFEKGTDTKNYTRTAEKLIPMSLRKLYIELGAKHLELK